MAFIVALIETASHALQPPDISLPCPCCIRPARKYEGSDLFFLGRAWIAWKCKKQKKIEGILGIGTNHDGVV